MLELRRDVVETRTDDLVAASVALVDRLAT